MNKFKQLSERHKFIAAVGLKLVFGWLIQPKKTAIAALFIIAYANGYGQTKETASFVKRDLYGYIDIAPLFFVAPAATLGAGIEYDRFQLGVLAIRGKKLPDSFKELVFANAQNIEFDKTGALEIVFKTYYKLTLRKIKKRSNRFEMLGEDSDNVCDDYTQDYFEYDNDKQVIEQNLSFFLTELPARQQEIVRLRFYENLSHQQIAELLQMNIQSAKNLLHRAIESLRRKILV